MYIHDEPQKFLSNFWGSLQTDTPSYLFIVPPVSGLNLSIIEVSHSLNYFFLPNCCSLCKGFGEEVLTVVFLVTTF